MSNSRSAYVMVGMSFLVGMLVTSLISGCEPGAKDGKQQPSTASKGKGGKDKTTPADKDGKQPSKEKESSPAKDSSAKEKDASNSEPEKNSNAPDENTKQVSTSAPAANPGDWAQWGGDSKRNNVPDATGIPAEWDPGTFNRKTREWEDSVNIKWVSPLGSQSYGNAVVADGRVFLGTNNGAGYMKRYPYQIDLGCLLAFNEADGAFLWQHSSEKLSTGRVHDWEQQGICCAPLVEGKRLWFVSSRGKVICLDTEGYHDGEDDGPVKNEWGRTFNIPNGFDAETVKELAPALAALGEGKLSDYVRSEFARVGFELPADLEIEAGERPDSWSFTAMVGDEERQFKLRKEGPKLAAYKLITTSDINEADTIWEFDMMDQLGTSQHNMCSCSVTALGDILFVNTSNGVDESHLNIPAPDAPSFFAMDKNTGEVHWTDSSPGTNILHGQWSSPTVAELGGVPQVIFAGGDGWVYSFKADEGTDGKPELLWEFDANPKTSKWILGGRGTRNNIIATPVVYNDLVYVAVGQDPEHGEGVGHLWCIDPTKRGDVSPELAVKIEDDKQVPIEPRRLQAVIEEDGEVAVKNENSAVVWHYSEVDDDGDGKFAFEETMHRSCGTVAIKDDILYIADFSGLLHCLDAKTGKRHWTYDMFAQAWGSPLIVDDKVYIGDEDGDVCIFELKAEQHDPIAEINMGSSVYSTPIVANGVLYIASRSYLFAIEEPQAE